MRKITTKSTTFTIIQCACLLFTGSAIAGPPPELPVPDDLHPCTLQETLPNAATTHAVFPCGTIVTDVAGSSAASAAITAAGATVRYEVHSVNTAAAVVNNQASLDALLANTAITVIPDRIVQAFRKPSGVGGGGSGGGTSQVIPDGVKRIGATPGALPVTGNGIGVAVVDTGVDLSNADLAVSGDCFDAYGQGCDDSDGHGTHVSGIIAAKNNSIDVVGVAPKATIYAVRVLGPTGGTDSAVMAGLQWVLDNANLVNPPIKVMNMSLGREGTVNDDPPFEALVTQLRDAGIAIAVAAGNDASLEVWQNIPAAYPEVMSVASTAATDGNNKCRGFNGFIAMDTASFYTTDGSGVTISAPGEDKEDISRACFIRSTGILSLKAGGGTTRMSGTSMASPHLAGVLALLAEQEGVSFDPEVARVQVQQGATGINTTPLDSPTTSYTFDGVREGVLSACGTLGSC